MKLLVLTILLLASPALAQNPTWDQWREKRETARRIEELGKGCSENQVKIAALEASLKYTDRLLWASLTGTGISGALGAAALKRRKQQ